MSNCETDDLKLQTPFGSCGCLHSQCGCFGKKEENIAKATRAELVLLENQIKSILEEAIKNNKKIPTFKVVTEP
jgi:hypothetical protein